MFKFLKLTKVSEIKRTILWKRNKNCKNVENLKLSGTLLEKQALKNNIQLVVETLINKFQLHIIKEKESVILGQGCKL